MESPQGAIRLVDTHTHLDEMEDLEEAIERARRTGVVAIIAVGTNYESNLRALEISEKHKSFVHPALGLHPWELGRMEARQIERTLKLIEGNIARTVGVGEIGLDYDKRVRATVDKDRQKGVFREALALAHRHDKPALIHSRYSWKNSLDLAREAKVRQAVFHWYTGFSSVLREILAEGYFISATPAAEYHDEHRRAIKETPLENLLLETDSPVEYGRERRYRSQPADVVRSLGAVARLKGSDENTVAERTTQNALRFLGLAL